MTSSNANKAIEWENGIPILTNDSLLSEVPAYTQALASVLNNLNQDEDQDQVTLPPGVIQAYVGVDAPDYWLLCDGSSYDPDKLPELSSVNANFHSDGVFRVPDFRGRSPIGTGGAGTARSWALGERSGDKSTGQHGHELIMNSGNGTQIGISSFNATGGGHGLNGAAGTAVTGPFFAQPYGPDYGASGVGGNYQPSTGVNFIIHAARPTKGVDLGKGSSIAAVTTRNLIEARLADPDIAEEERSMLEGRLASL